MYDGTYGIYSYENPSNDLNIHYNIVYEVTDKALWVDNDSDNVSVYNNTFYTDEDCDKVVHITDQDSRCTAASTPYACCDGLDDGPTCDEVNSFIFKNNIVVGAGSCWDELKIEQTTGYTLNYNLYYAPTLALDLNNSNYSTIADWRTALGGCGDTSINDCLSPTPADPLFTNAANGNFALSSTSPCIDQGADVGLTSDYAGTSVPKDIDGITNADDGTDIGAYEYYSMTGVVYDWLGNALTTITVRVYAYTLIGTGNSTHPDGNEYIATTTSNPSDGSWELNDVDLVSGTEYFIVYLYGGTYQAADGKTYGPIVGCDFKTAP